MTEIYKLKSYSCATKEIYDKLKEAKLSKSELKKYDKDNDKKISEDEFAEFEEEIEETDNEETNEKDNQNNDDENSSSSGFYSDDERIKNLETQYQMQERLYYSKLSKITQLNMLLAQAEFEVAAYPKDSEARQSAQGTVENIQGKINEANSEASSCIDSMSEIRTNISQRQVEIENEAKGISTNGTNGKKTKGGYTKLGKLSTTKTKTIDSNLAKRLDAKLGSGFAAKCEQVASKLKCNPNDLLAMMYSESGINPQCSGAACGLICFMPSVLASKGLTQSQVISMNGVEQLDLVYSFLNESKTSIAGLSSSQKLDAGTLYAMCFLPAFAKQEVLCSSGDPSTAIYYNANSGLDIDNNGNISKTDLAKRLQKKFNELNQYF